MIEVALDSLTPYLLDFPFLGFDTYQYAGGTLSPESPVRTFRKRNSSGSTSITETFFLEIIDESNFLDCDSGEDDTFSTSNKSLDISFSSEVNHSENP